MDLPALKPSGLHRLIGKTADIALLLDAKDLIIDVSMVRPELNALGCERWLGKGLVDVVTTESIVKVQELIKTCRADADAGWRQVNHPVPGLDDVALQYTGMLLDKSGQMLLLGRDMQAISQLQRRLVETQQSMERDFVRLRHVESRYRVLLDTSREPVLLVDAKTDKVSDANIAAQALVRDSQRRLVGRDVFDCFEEGNHDDIKAALRMALATGRIEIFRARPVGANAECSVSCVMFRQEAGAQLLLRMFPVDASVASPHSVPGSAGPLDELMRRAPVGLLLTDRQGRIQEANEEFLQLLGALSAGQLQGQPMEDWLARNSVDWGVIKTHLRQLHTVRGFATELKTLSGLNVPVEISAISLSEPDGLYAFFVRDVLRQRVIESPAASPALAGQLSELSSLVGRMPIKDIVGETTDMIERSCIQSALTLTQNNRASAAEMLGLSRQSLYVKLRRFGMLTEDEKI
ncbi:MAG: transcriptional regulator PpsR [Alphaproteobacteria bacterium]|nr:transcriptional regulator PpsR [Alphaproteobacteria bacterium]